jgi:hypothetical protein
MDISTGLRISSFLHNSFPLIAVGCTFLLCIFLLCRKKAPTEQKNSYGIDKATNKDPLYAEGGTRIMVTVKLIRNTNGGLDYLFRACRYADNTERAIYVNGFGVNPYNLNDAYDRMQGLE